MRKNIKVKELKESKGAEKAADAATNRWGVGIPLSLWRKDSRNRRMGKEIEGIFRCKTTRLQRSLNGAMKGREREESNAQALGS